MEEKQLYGYFKWQTEVIAQEITWIWLTTGNLNLGTDSLLSTAQNKATIVFKGKLIIPDRIASVGYMETDMKWVII